MALGFFDLEVEAVLTVVAHHLVLGSGTTFEKQSSHRVFQIILQGTLERTGTLDRIETGLRDRVQRRRRHLKDNVLCSDAFGKFGHLDLGN